MSAIVIPAPTAEPKRLSDETFWGIVLIAPYFAVFALFVVFPVLYGIWLGSNPAAYTKLFQDPIFFSTIVNTVVFQIVEVSIMMEVTLVLCGFFLYEVLCILCHSVLLLLGWAAPSLHTILPSCKMLTTEWLIVTARIFYLFRAETP